ncbi:TAXI family TRAP transporter solute-binding subunit [Hoeflea alexandrii]|uniref:TAXI family TRAP transporter solute-binding subunit n=1 Tax=Hoeflea alexandrii TaxID=288436 RepID=UPI002D1E450A|nr:TAXI family TRAP transporter solute-binding subunit [Hoeflea alexandrii]
MFASSAFAETRITYKSAKTGSSYYQMGVQLAEAMKAGTDGEIIVTVEESQGSVQNVMEAKARGGDYVFTTPCGVDRACPGRQGDVRGQGRSEIRRDPGAVSDPVADHAFRHVG